MIADEPARHRLYQRLEDVLGVDEARTLMAMLPTNVAELATKQDLQALEQRLIGTLHRELAGQAGTFHRELAVQTRTFIFATLGSMLTLAGLNIAVVQAVT